MSVQLGRIFDLLKIIFSGKIIDEYDEVKRRRKTFETLSSDIAMHQGDTLVSVVIPTKNESHFLERCIGSILSSSYRPIEVVVVDYMSADGTVEIAKGFGVKVIEVDESGVGYASHVGVVNSVGDIVIRTDADSIFNPELIKNTVNYFDLNQDIMLKHIGHYYYDGGFIANMFALLYDKYWRDVWKTTGYFLAFRKDIYFDVGGFDVNKKVGEDFDFGKKVHELYQISYDPNELIFISDRRIKHTGLIKYLLGLRNR